MFGFRSYSKPCISANMTTLSAKKYSWKSGSVEVCFWSHTSFWVFTATSLGPSALDLTSRIVLTVSCVGSGILPGIRAFSAFLQQEPHLVAVN